MLVVAKVSRYPTTTVSDWPGEAAVYVLVYPCTPVVKNEVVVEVKCGITGYMISTVPGVLPFGSARVVVEGFGPMPEDVVMVVYGSSTG